MSEEVEEHINFLINNPDKTLGSIYHDAGACWLLIERLLERLRRSEKAAKERERELVDALQKSIRDNWIPHPTHADSFWQNDLLSGFRKIIDDHLRTREEKQKDNGGVMVKDNEIDFDFILKVDRPVDDISYLQGFRQACMQFGVWKDGIQNIGAWEIRVKDIERQIEEYVSSL